MQETRPKLDAHHGTRGTSPAGHVAIVTPAGTTDTTGLSLPFRDATVVHDLDALDLASCTTVVVLAHRGDDRWWRDAVARAASGAPAGSSLVVPVRPDAAVADEDPTLELSLHGVVALGGRQALEMRVTAEPSMVLSQLVQAMELVDQTRELTQRPHAPVSDGEAELLDLLETTAARVEDLERSNAELTDRLQALASSRLGRLTVGYWGARRRLRQDGVVGSIATTGRRGLRRGRPMLRRLRANLVPIAMLVVLAAGVVAGLAWLDASPATWIGYGAGAFALVVLLLAIRRVLHSVEGVRRAVGRHAADLLAVAAAAPTGPRAPEPGDTNDPSAAPAVGGPGDNGAATPDG